MANDLDAILVLVLGTVAAFGALLYLLAFLEPATTASTNDLTQAPPRPVRNLEIVHNEAA